MKDETTLFIERLNQERNSLPVFATSSEPLEISYARHTAIGRYSRIFEEEICKPNRIANGPSAGKTLVPMIEDDRIPEGVVVLKNPRIVEWTHLTGWSMDGITFEVVDFRPLEER